MIDNSQVYSTPIVVAIIVAIVVVVVVVVVVDVGGISPFPFSFDLLCFFIRFLHKKKSSKS